MVLHPLTNEPASWLVITFYRGLGTHYSGRILELHPRSRDVVVALHIAFRKEEPVAASDTNAVLLVNAQMEAYNEAGWWAMPNGHCSVQSQILLQRCSCLPAHPQQHSA